MKDWQTKAREAITLAAYGSDPEAVPEYQVPKPRPWWEFWRPTEYETVRGVSRAALERVQEAIDQDLRERSRRLKEMYPDASPFTNLYAPWLDPPSPSGSPAQLSPSACSLHKS